MGRNYKLMQIVPNGFENHKKFCHKMIAQESESSTTYIGVLSTEALDGFL